MKNLATAYRPTEFQHLIGQRLVATVLSRMVAKDQIPPGLLFTGPSGTGKTSAARLVANKLQGEATEANKLQVDVIEVDAASNGRVEDARALMDSLKYSGGRRVLILDEAHNMTKEAFNVLLKPLEEPPAGVLFILVTTEPDKIPETVKKRLIEFEFRRVSTDNIFEHLQKVSIAEGRGLPDPFLYYLAESAHGNVRTALNSLNQVILSEIKTLEEFREISGNEDFGPSIVLAIVSKGIPEVLGSLKEALKRTSLPSDVSQQILRVLRDLLVIKSGGSIGEVSKELDNISPRVSRDELVVLCRAIWELKTKIKSSDDPRGNLQLAVVLMHEALNKLRGVSVAVAQPAPLQPQLGTGMTLAEMRARVGQK